MKAEKKIELLILVDTHISQKEHYKKYPIRL